MSQIDAVTQSALSQLAGFNDAYAGATANNGEGFAGEWPPEGLHACTVRNILVKPMSKKFKNKKEAGKEYEFQGVLFQFVYVCNQVVEGQKDPSVPLEWKGEPMFIPSNPAAIPASMDWVKTMSTERLKGHLGVINGTIGSNIQADVAAALTKITSGTVIVNVDVQGRDGNQSAEDKAAGKKAARFKSEYLKEALAS